MRRTYSAGVALPEAAIPEQPREILRRGVTGRELEFCGWSIRAGDLPLFARDEQGTLRQCVRVVARAEHDATPVRASIVLDVETSRDAPVFLGLRDDADVASFEHAARAARAGESFDPGRFLQTYTAEQHRLYLIPGGTPHASGAGNVVLEISATPYVYTLRFYDWLRRDLDGRLRPVHLEHAFANLDTRRRGAAVRDDLVQEPRELRSGDGWRELVLGELSELFFAVHRLDFEHAIDDDTAGRFHLLNLVAGDAAAIETSSGSRHELAYAETIVVPARVGRYTIADAGRSACKVVKAFVT